jgi:type II secretory ATPase GspE/PulE/Tfp pilus assembly ATPase PilB-like protein
MATTSPLRPEPASGRPSPQPPSQTRVKARLAPSEITIGLVEGGMKTGSIQRFSPHDADIDLQLSGAQVIRLVLAAERVAFVGFHRERGVSDGGRPDRGWVTRRVQVHGAAPFLVRAVASELESRLGFYARPEDPDSKYAELFFYTHGVETIEDIAPLGEMLVGAGHLTPEQLARALREQESRRNVPIGQLLVEQHALAPASLEDALALQALRRKRLGEILVEEGLARKEDIDAALAEQKKRAGKRLGEVLVELGLVTEVVLAATLARKFHLPFVNLDECAVNQAAADEVGPEMLQSLGVLPLDADARTLTVAIADPLAADVRDRLRFFAKKQIREVVVTPSQLKGYVAEALARITQNFRPAVDQILDELAADEVTTGDGPEGNGPVEVKESDSAVIKLVNQIIADACRAGASDIHIEPNGAERNSVVRFRVDGECIAYRDIPPAYRRSLVTRLKVMAKLDIAERRKPQDGKIRIRLRNSQIELRLATLPTVGDNEDVVLRVLADSKPLPLEKLALAPRNLAALRELIARPYGLVLCVGPTGSGKTTTLHSALGAINTIDTKIWTAEDPVEITQPGLRQVQVNPKIGFTFATALRAFLRADPDVIMVGEMRDLETAAIAIEASLTGHVVFSTLHTNSAPETVTRLLDMGLDPFTFSDALLGVLAQRLARTLCKGCRTQVEATEAELSQIARCYDPARLEARCGVTVGPGLKLWHAKGCDACGRTGYRGRMAIHELLVSDASIRELVARRAPVAEIRRAAVAAGMTTLVQDGIEKAIAGEVDLLQVLPLGTS